MATTIEVSDETWRKLNSKKEPGESFDDVVMSLLYSEMLQDETEINVTSDDIVLTEDGAELDGQAKRRAALAEGCDE